MDLNHLGNKQIIFFFTILNNCHILFLYISDPYSNTREILNNYHILFLYIY